MKQTAFTDTLKNHADSCEKIKFSLCSVSIFYTRGYLDNSNSVPCARFFCLQGLIIFLSNSTAWHIVCSKRNNVWGCHTNHAGCQGESLSSLYPFYWQVRNIMTPWEIRNNFSDFSWHAVLWKEEERNVMAEMNSNLPFAISVFITAFSFKGAH